MEQTLRPAGLVTQHRARLLTSEKACRRTRHLKKCYLMGRDDPTPNSSLFHTVLDEVLAIIGASRGLSAYLLAYLRRILSFFSLKRRPLLDGWCVKSLPLVSYRGGTLCRRIIVLRSEDVPIFLSGNSPLGFSRKKTVQFLCFFTPAVRGKTPSWGPLFRDVKKAHICPKNCPVDPEF